jgi:SAM-dependent methyltransferase
MLQKSPTIEKILKEEIEEDVPCPICAAKNISQNDKVLASTGYPNVKFTSVICKNCGLIRINPRMPESGFVRFYKEAFFEYLSPYDRPAYIDEIENTTNDKHWTPTRKWLLPYLLPWVKEGGRVLDIGAGFGVLLYYLKKQKNIIGVGLEPDPESARIAREKIGVDVIDETIESYFQKNRSENSSEQKFDFIILNQAFEHLLSPLETLKEIKKRLSPEGVIYIGVPNAYNFTAPSSLLHQLAHTYNYSPYHLSEIARLAGLRVFNIRGTDLYPLEVLLCHPEANYPVENADRLAAGSDYKVILFRLYRHKLIEDSRTLAKNILNDVFGEKVKNKIRNIIDKYIK